MLKMEARHLVFVLLVFCSLSEWAISQNGAMFKEWQVMHGKKYPSKVIENERFRIFSANTIRVKELNTLHEGKTVFELNQFADMTSEEFQQTILMPRSATPKFGPERYMPRLESHDPLPDEFDWREFNKVTPVRNQGTVGTCWAFSTIGNIESQWLMQNQSMTEFAVEQIVDCDATKDPKNDHADCGVFGGWPYLAYQYVEGAGGLEKESDYSYCVGNGACFPCQAPGYNSTLCGPAVPYCLKNESCAAKVNSAKFVPGLKVVDWKAIPEDEDEIARQLMTTGPFSVALDASLLSFYKTGVFEPPFCSKTALDHAVLMVGFGSENGPLGTTPYWLIKNSWGDRWGEKGYFKIRRGKGTCGINTQVTTAVLTKV